MRSEKASPFDGALLEGMLRQGQQQAVKVILTKLKAKSIPLTQAHLFANHLRRSGESLRAIRYLASFLNSDSRKSKLAVKIAPIQAELAATLNSIGAPEQAAHLLKNLKESDYPKVFLYRAFVHISRWEYAKAKIEIGKYLPLVTDAYDEVTAKSNLAACDVALDSRQESKILIEELEDKVSKTDYKFLESNVLLLKAQYLIQQEKLGPAQSILEQLILKTKSPNTQVLIGKWIWVVQATLSKSSQQRKELEKSWDELSQKALALRLTEVVRDLDLKRALLFEDSHLLKKVFHGTPFPDYKSRVKNEIEEHFKITIDPVAEFHWKVPSPLNDRPSGKARIEQRINLMSGQTHDAHVFFKQESTLHRLFKILSSDLYRAWGAPSIHSALYPDMIYNPTSSPGLVFEHIQRLRRFLKTHHIAASVIRKDNFFHLQLRSNMTLIYNSQSSLSGGEALWMQELKKSLKETKFTAQRAEDIWKIPKRSVQRRLQKLVRRKLLALSAEGKNSTYRILS